MPGKGGTHCPIQLPLNGQWPGSEWGELPRTAMQAVHRITQSTAM